MAQPMRFAALLFVVMLAACGDSTAPAPPNLTGTWSGPLEGLTWTMSLSDVDQVISGTSVLSGPGGQLQGTVNGSHRHPNFAVTIYTPGFYSVGFAGIADASQLRGLITGSGFTGDSLVLDRQ